MELTGLLGSGAIDISVLEPRSWPLDEINEAISGVSSGAGGFTSYLVEI
jgi:alcohol dehydrogenase